MTDDDKFEELVRLNAADYNRPPATPRDEMWAVIQSGLRAGAPLDAPAVVELPRHRARRWWPTAIAAGLLLGTGIGIGRLMTPGGSTDGQQRVAVQPPPATTVDSTMPGTTPMVVARSDESRPPRNGTSKPTPGSERSARDTASMSSPTYQLATVKHLTEVEALLTSYRADSEQGKVDAQVATWARDLLSNTRLLIDSPAASDPLRRRLLEDLELVLVQIVQLSPGGAAGDREMIEGAMKRGQVLTRLRTAIPAGQTSGT